MIEEIRIENFALLDDIQIVFHDGFNVIMGETGSGKSSLIDAISILFGDRASKEKIRKNKDESYLSITLNISDKEILSFLDSIKINIKDEPIIISRTIRRNSSTLTKINGQTVTVQDLVKLSSYIIDIYGQFDNMLILSRKEQLKFLDKMGDKNFDSLLFSYEETYQKYIYYKEKLDSLKRSPEEQARDLEMYLYQYNEIKDSNFLHLDEDKIMKKIEFVENSQEIKDNLTKVIDLFERENGILSSLGSSIQNISNTVTYSNELKEILERIESSLIDLDDINYETKIIFSNLDFDEEEYYELDKIRSSIFQIKRKYGNSKAEVESFFQNLEQKILELENYQLKVNDLNKKIAEFHEKGLKKAKEISYVRKRLAKILEEKVLEELASLDMKKSDFNISFNKTELSSSGIDDVDFLISFNKNQKLMRFSDVASGGEISRFMLGIKSIQADIDNTPILIFDEIDTGISGNAGDIVGEKLRKLSLSHVLITVSHLPQIIAKADHQYLVTKYMENDNVFSEIKELNYEERIIEVAKSIQGNDYNEYTLKTAKEMIDRNQGDKA